MPRRATHRGHGGPRAVQYFCLQASTPDLTSLGGLIMWLKERDRLPEHFELPEGCYNHPVVLLSPQVSSYTDEVVILIVTSLNETDVRDKLKRNLRLRRAYLPIYPAENQDTTIELHLENGAELPKKSYVSRREKHTIPLFILQPHYIRHTRTQYVLTDDSYKILARHVGFALPAIPSINHAPAAIRTTRTAAPAIATLTRDERLHLTSLTYGTIPISRGARPPAPPPAAVARGYDTVTRPLLYDDYLTALQHISSAPRQRHHYRDEDLLPRHYSNRPAYYHTAAGGAAGREETRAFMRLVLRGVLFGVWLWGVWLAWTHRGQIWSGLLSGLGWVGAHIFRLVKAAGAGLVRAVVWLVARIVEVVKTGAVRLWEWLRSGGSEVQLR